MLVWAGTPYIGTLDPLGYSLKFFYEGHGDIYK